MPLNHLHPYRRVRFTRGRLAPLLALPRRPRVLTAVLLTAYWLPIVMLMAATLPCFRFGVQPWTQFAGLLMFHGIVAAMGFWLFLPRLWPPILLAVVATLYDTCVCAMPIILHGHEVTPAIIAAAVIGAVCWVVLIVTAFLYRHAMQHHPAHCCAACGYDMRGLDEGAPCPECGMERVTKA